MQCVIDEVEQVRHPKSTVIQFDDDQVSVIDTLPIECPGAASSSCVYDGLEQRKRPQKNRIPLRSRQLGRLCM